MINAATVLFRVNANSAIGAGHLMRCIALAYSFKAKGLNICFLVSSDTEKQNLLQRFPFEYLVVPPELDTPDGLMHEIAWLRLVSELKKACLMVVDGYQFIEAYRLQMKTLSFPWVMIDDCNDSGLIHADVVLNSLNAARLMDYHATAPHSVHLLGDQYTLLRPEFCAGSQSEFHRRTNCLIMFGGADVLGLTVPVLEEMQQIINFLQNIVVVTGAGYKEPDKLQSWLVRHGADNKIRHLHNYHRMDSLYQNTTLCITAAGGSLFELAAMGVPSVAVIVADNQLKAALEQQGRGWCVALDGRAHNAVSKIVSVAQMLWEDFDKRKHMHELALQSSVVNGADRAVTEILKTVGSPGVSNVG